MRPLIVAVVAVAAAATVGSRPGFGVPLRAPAGRFAAPEARRPTAPRTIVVGVDNVDLQSALNNANPGDTILLTPGTTYTGPFVLPAKSGDSYITIEPMPSARGLPAVGTRVNPSDATIMSKLVASSGSVLTADLAAHHYHLLGLEITSTAGVHLTNLIDLGSAATSADQTPHDFQIDRCYIHGDPSKGARRGIALNSAATTISDSYFADFKEVGADSQAVAGWNGPGPFVLTDNYLEGAGENVMFGGADPSIPNLVPSNIQVTQNTFAKPLTWEQGSPQYQGTLWTVKNLFELKNAEHVTVNGNIFEYNWVQAQDGFSILFTVRNQDGTAPWSTVDDVTFTNNVVQHVPAVFNILGHDDINQSGPCQNIRIQNNLLLDVGGTWTVGRLLQVLNGTANLTVAHNTSFQTESVMTAGEQPNPGLVFQDNIAPHNQYGVIGDGTGIDNPSLAQWFPGAVFQGNVLIGGDGSQYPSGNWFPGSVNAVGFTSTAGFNAGLLPTSPFKGKESDRTDPGIDVLALTKALGAQALGRANGGTTVAIASLLGPLGSGLSVSLAAVLFWGSVALLIYIYLGYGLVAWLTATVRGRPRQARSAEDHLPLLTVVVVAFNEAGRMARRLENLLSLDYPRDRLEIIVASDGSTDETVALARRYEPCVRVIAFSRRRGKAAVLNDVVPEAAGEIVVLADARQRFDREALQALVAPFADPAVGGVSGELVLRTRSSTSAAGAGVYWTYEKRLRAWESRIDSTMGATGAIYAIRKDLFEAFPADTILDDVVIPARIVHRGFRVLFEPRAVAYDELPASPRDEFVRKVRTIAGTFQFFARERWALKPSENRVWLQTLSHKALRLVIPAAYFGAFVANLALLGRSPIYAWTMLLQAGFYGSAIAATLWPSLRRRVKPLVVPHMLCLLSWATIVAFHRFLTGAQQVTWERAMSARAR